MSKINKLLPSAVLYVTTCEINGCKSPWTKKDTFFFFSFFLFVKILCDSLRLLDSQLFDRLTDAAISSENTQRSEPKSLNVPVVVFIFVCIVVVIYLCCRCPPHLPVLLMFWENCPRCHCQGFDRS